SCADSSSCVTSFETESKSYLEPITSEEDQARIRKKILGIIAKDSQAKIIEDQPEYLRAEFHSSLFGFIDDVEFWFGETGKVHFRSASRRSFSDFGNNRDRIESIRFKFHQNDF